MIIVLGSIAVVPERFAEALAASQAHVARSRGEPGCLSHAVYRDPEDAHRLVFVEQWASAPSLQAHFAVPASRAFVRQLAAMATAPPSIRWFDAAERTGDAA